MSILGTFAMLFEADTNGLKVGLDEAKSKGEKLSNELKNVERATEGASNKMNDLAALAGKAVGAFLSIAAAKAAITTFSDGANEAKFFSDSVGQNMQDLQAWSAAVVNAGGTADGFKGTVKGLTEELGKVDRMKATQFSTDLLTNTGVKALDEAGKAKSAMQIMRELAESKSIKGQSAAQQNAVLKTVGITDEGSIALIRKGTAAIDEIVNKQKVLGVYTEADAEKARAFKMSMQDLSRTTESLSAVFMRVALPPLKLFNMLLTAGADYLKKHEWAANTAGVVVTTVLVAAMGLATVAMIGFGKSAVVAGWQATVAMAPLIVPLLAIVAAIMGIGAALYIINEDYEKFLAGSKDAEWPWEDILNAIAKVDVALKATIRAFGQMCAAIVDFFINSLKGVANGVMWLLDKMNLFGGKKPEYFTYEMNVLNQTIENQKIHYDLDESTKLKKPRTSQQSEQDILNSQVKTAQAQLSLTNTPLSALTNNTVSNIGGNTSKNVQLSISNIEIKTNAQDSKALTQDIYKNLDDQMKNALHGFSAGIAG
jgi:hypothetical protein